MGRAPNEVVVRYSTVLSHITVLWGKKDYLKSATSRQSEKNKEERGYAEKKQSWTVSSAGGTLGTLRTRQQPSSQDSDVPLEAEHRSGSAWLGLDRES